MWVGRLSVATVAIGAAIVLAATGAALAQEGGDGGTPPSMIAPPSASPPPKSGTNPVEDFFRRLFGKKTEATPAPRARRAVAHRRRTARRARTPRETAPSGQPAATETRYLADQVIVRYRLTARQRDLDALVAQLNLRHLDGRTFLLAGVTVHRYAIASGASVADTVAALEADPNVVYAQPNYLYQPAQNGAAAGGAQYALDRLDLRPALEVTRGGGVRIAIIDSAIDTGHPELAHAAVEVIDVADASSEKPAPHGTSIAGVIAAGATLSGVAPDARLIGVTAFAPDGAGHERGNSWTVAHALDAGWKAGARIFNLSFAGPPDPLVRDGLAGAAARGIVAFAAAGNDGPDAAPLYPAAYPGAIAVTATDDRDGVYASANGGDYVELAAPGVDILALAPGGSFTFSSGTSLATAHASGLAALALAVAPTLTPAQLETLIAGSATDLGAPGRDPVFGAGIPDAMKMVEAARAGG